MIEVTVRGPVKCTHCGGHAAASGIASRARTAVRHARRWYLSDELPATFAVHQWSRGEVHRLVFAGDFSTWEDLLDVVHGVTSR